jgi:hypothetical protein
MVFSIAQILGGIIAPAIGVALLAAIGWKFCRDARWLFGPLIAAAFCAAYLAVEIHIGWPPTANVTFLLFYFTLAAGALTLIDSLAKPPLWLRVIILALLWRIGADLIIRRLIHTSLSPAAAELWIDFSTLSAISWFLIFEHLSAQAPGITAPLFLTILSLSCAVFLALGLHIQSSGVLAGDLALICICAVTISLLVHRTEFSRGFSQMVVFILQLLLFHGYFYTDDNLTAPQQIHAALLLAAPLLCLLGDLPAARDHRSALMRLTIRLLPAIIVLTAISALTARDFFHADQAAATPADEE